MDARPGIACYYAWNLHYRGKSKPPKPNRFKVDRALLVRDLETLADWGEKAATGAFFILHIGI